MIFANDPYHGFLCLQYQVITRFTVLIKSYAREAVSDTDSNNPFAPPSESDIDPRSVEHSSDGRPLRAFILAAGLVASVMLAQYCALDFFVVRIRPYPDEVHDYDSLVLLFPFLPIMLLLAATNRRLQSLRGRWFIASIFCGFLVSIPLIATVGVWFHFSIGGKL